MIKIEPNQIWEARDGDRFAIWISVKEGVGLFPWSCRKFYSSLFGGYVDKRFPEMSTTSLGVKCDISWTYLGQACPLCSYICNQKC